MKFQVKRVTGVQADMAKRLGLVKIAASSAEQLFNLGVPIIVVGNKVNDHHFFGGWGLASPVDSDRWLSEGRSFKGMVGNWSQYNENSETGKAAFFVRSKYVASPADVASAAKKRGRKRPALPNPPRRAKKASRKRR